MSYICMTQWYWRRLSWAQYRNVLAHFLHDQDAHIHCDLNKNEYSITANYLKSSKTWSTKIVPYYISYLHSENHFQWNLDGSDKCNCKVRSYKLPQDGNCVHHGYKNRLNRKKKSNSSSSFSEDITSLSTRQS